MSLGEVRINPYSNQLFNLAPVSPIQAKQLRISHMLIEEGCTEEEIKYRVPRFDLMHRYFTDNEADFRKLGFFILDDEGGREIAPAKLLRAIHETFRGELPMGIHATPAEKVATLANSYPPEWIYD